MYYPNNNYMNPMQNAQQRLAQMEQAYPQFVNYNPYMQQQQQFQPQAQQFMKCRPVSSYDEAKASMIDLDGSVNVFTDFGNKKIYTKQINLDGTATIETYVKVESPEEKSKSNVEKQEVNGVYLSQDELEEIVDNMVENKLKEYFKKNGGNVNERKWNARNDVKNDARTVAE